MGSAAFHPKRAMRSTQICEICVNLRMIPPGGSIYFSTVTSVFTEFAMKQFSWAKWCISSMSFSVG